jgi:hypothetical protein
MHFRNRHIGDWANLLSTTHTGILLVCLGLIHVDARAATVSVPRDASCGIHRARELYSVEQNGALFERPMNFRQLLSNLKLATDKNFFLEQGFYTDENLLKFFGGSKVVKSSRNTSDPRTFTQRIFRMVGGEGDLLQVKAEILKSCQLISHYPSPGGEVPTHVRAISGVVIDMAAVPAATVGAVRAVFGKESRAELDTGETFDGNFVALVSKGSLRYEKDGKAASADSELKKSSVTFVVALPSGVPKTPARRIVDEDLIQRVNIQVMER